jgi:hypothetical protein
MAMALTARILKLDDLSSTDVCEMYALMDRHYENVWRDRFEADLSEKDWIIRLTEEGTGTLCGFSTQRVLSVSVDRRPVTVLFSGNTIVERQHWGTTALPIAWGRLAFSIIEQHSEEELYWYLISKGYRTYRFLPLFFKEFYPRHDIDTPSAMRAVLDAIAQSKYPDRYDIATGVIRATATSDRLRPDLGEVTDAKLRDPDIEFFHTLNPGHVNGDELCCIAPLTHQNFSSSAWKLIRSPRFVLQTVG